MGAEDIFKDQGYVWSRIKKNILRKFTWNWLKIRWNFPWNNLKNQTKQLIDPLYLLCIYRNPSNGPRSDNFSGTSLKIATKNFNTKQNHFFHLSLINIISNCSFLFLQFLIYCLNLCFNLYIDNVLFFTSLFPKSFACDGDSNTIFIGHLRQVNQ